MTFAATAGETYYVIVDGFNGASGSYTIDAVCDAELQCTPDIAAGCNTYDEWATTAKGSTDLIDSYSCSIFDESGREYAYQFSSPVDTTVTVNLAPEAGQDLDLFLIGGAQCAPETCDRVRQLDHHVRCGRPARCTTLLSMATSAPRATTGSTSSAPSDASRGNMTL